MVIHGAFRDDGGTIGSGRGNTQEYELVREIKNLCRNNQMRDIYFEEGSCESPELYVRNLLRGRQLELSVEAGDAGTVTIHAAVDGLMQEFVFTPI